MARWIDGDPKVRARMMKQHEEMINRETIKKQAWIRSEIKRYEAKIAEACDTLEWSKSATLDKTLKRRIETWKKEIADCKAALEKAGLPLEG